MHQANFGAALGASGTCSARQFLAEELLAGGEFIESYQLKMNPVLIPYKQLLDAHNQISFDSPPTRLKWEPPPARCLRIKPKAKPGVVTTTQQPDPKYYTNQQPEFV